MRLSEILTELGDVKLPKAEANKASVQNKKLVHELCHRICHDSSTEISLIDVGHENAREQLGLLPESVYRIMAVFKAPFTQDNFQVVAGSTFGHSLANSFYHAYTTKTFRKSTSDAEASVLLSKKKKMLNAHKFTCWANSIIQAAISSLQKKLRRADVHSLVQERHDGHIELKVLLTEKSRVIDIHIFPVIRHFDWPLGAKYPESWPMEVRKELMKLMKSGSPVCLLQPSPSQADEKAWTVCLPLMDKVLIENGGCLKQVMQFMYLLASSRQWYCIANSEAIKTVALVLFDQYGQGGPWNSEDLDVFFIACLDELRLCLQRRHIAHFFFPWRNLVADLDTKQLEDVEKDILDIMLAIKEDPASIKTYFSS